MISPLSCTKYTLLLILWSNKLVKSFLEEVCQLQWTSGWVVLRWNINILCGWKLHETKRRRHIKNPNHIYKIHSSNTNKQDTETAVITAVLQLSGWNITVRSGQILPMPWLKVPTCNRGPSSYSLVLLTTLQDQGEGRLIMVHSTSREGRSRPCLTWSWRSSPSCWCRWGHLLKLNLSDLSIYTY